MCMARGTNWLLMMRNKMNKNLGGDRTDRIFRNSMLATGILTALLFLGSLVALAEFPGAFSWLAIGMIGVALVFLVLRTIYRYRSTFRVKEKK